MSQYRQYWEEDKEVQQEGKTKPNRWKMGREFFTVFGVLLLFIFLCIILQVFTEHKEAQNKKKQDQRMMTDKFQSSLESSYGLRKGDYTVTDEYFRRHSASIHGCKFRVGDKTYEEIGGFTDYCSQQLMDVIAEQFRQAAEAAGISDGETYSVEKISFEYTREQTKSIFDTEAKDKLPVWINAAEIAKYADGSYDRDRWADLFNLRIEVLTDSKEAASLSESAIKKLEIGPFSKEILVIKNGSQTYEYRIR